MAKRKVKIQTPNQAVRKMKAAMRKKPNKSAVSETVFKLIESVNEIFSYGEFGSAKRLFLLIDQICENNEISMPDEGVSLNIELDNHFGYDVLSARY